MTNNETFLWNMDLVIEFFDSYPDVDFITLDICLIEFKKRYGASGSTTI